MNTYVPHSIAGELWDDFLHLSFFKKVLVVFVVVLTVVALYLLLGQWQWLAHMVGPFGRAVLAVVITTLLYPTCAVVEFLREVWRYGQAD